MVRSKENINKIDDVIKCMSHIMEEFDGAWEFYHQYEKVLEVSRDIKRIEDKLDCVMESLKYLNVNIPELEDEYGK